MGNRPKVKTVVSTFSFSTNLRQSARRSCRRPLAALGLLFVVLSLAAPKTFATDFSWTNTAVTPIAYTNTTNWAPLGPPVTGDNAFLTNYIGASSVTATITNGTATVGLGIVTNANLTVFNDSTGVYTLLLSNTTFRVTSTTKLGNNSVVQIGITNNATSTSIFSNNNLFLTANAAIVFNGQTAIGSLTNHLIVAGAFSNDVNTSITNNTSNGGGMVRLLFTANAPVTNKGTINLSGISSGSALNTALVVQVGTAGALNTFRNEGTFTIGVGGGGGNGARVYVFSNQLVNAGTFVITNRSTNTRTTNMVFVTGNGAGAAITNLSTGTIKMSAQLGTERYNILTNVADIVNLGTISGDSVAGAANIIDLAAGNVFSNALGGQVIVAGAGPTNLLIQADTVVNLGTNVINSGTLLYRTAAGGANTLANQGTILFAGGNLDINTLTNTTTGVIKVTNGVNAIVGTFFENNGTIDIGSSTLSNYTVTAAWTNSSTGRVLINDGTIRGGQVVNQGTVNSAGTAIIISSAGSTVTNAAGGTYIVSATSTNLRFSTSGADSGASNNFSNAGIFTFNSGTISVSKFVNSGTFDSAHATTGTISARGVGHVFSNAPTGVITVNSGTVLYGSGGATATGGVDNAGVITAYGNGVFGTVGTLPAFTNTTIGTIINTNSAATLGIQANGGNIFNLGDIIVSNGATINLLNSGAGASGNTLTNFSTGRVLVGSATSDGILNSGTIANSGSIAGSGTLNLAIGTGGHPLDNLNTGTLAVLNGRLLTVTNVGGLAFRDIVTVDVQTNTFNIYNAGTIIVGTGASELRFASGTNSAGANVPLSMLNTGVVVMSGGTLTFQTPGRSTLSNVTAGVIRGLGVITNALLFNEGTGRVVATNGQLRLESVAVGPGTYEARAGASAATLTFVDGGSISSLFNTGATIRVESLLTNAGSVFINAGTLAVVGGGTYVNTADLNTLVGGVVTVNTSRVIVGGAYTGASGSTLTMINSVGTFGTVVNSGAWITDPSTNIFNGDHTETSSGFIAASAGDVYIFKSNFVNQSTQNTTYDTMNTTPGGSGAAGTKFIFDGTNTVSSSGYTQQFFTAGLKLTGGFSGTPSPLSNGVQFVTSFPAVTGFVDNFALDRLEIGNLGTNSILELFDSFPSDGTNAALFVNDLWLLGSSQLILSNNTVLYFVNSNAWSMANISLLGNAELHQLTLEQVSAVPEPSVILLWVCGIATVYAARRRARALKK